MVKYKESESESEGASHAPEPCFRVRVCMEQFYSADDVRARAYVCVSPRRRVRWLARRLRRLFALPRLHLLSRGHLLPPQEPLALLQPDDPVECVPRVWPEDTADARDVVDSVDEVQLATAEEPERSQSPVYPDDLTETKRQALMMLEQFCAEPAAEHAAERATRPRRRRVRRRRRVPPSAAHEHSLQSAHDEPTPGAALEHSLQSAGSAGTDADDEPAPVPGSAGTDADDEPAPVPGSADTDADDEPALVPDSPATVLREPDAVAMVLRNDLQPRAPRVVRPLTERIPASLLDTPPTEIVIG